MKTPVAKSNNKSFSRPSRGGTQLAPTAIAARMISETAHDIRAPLATIRESVRLVCDGDLGDVSDEQRECLVAAIDQCNCVDQMIGEMVQLERLQTGIPRVRRQWVAISDIRVSIDDTLRPWAMPRNISVLWDVADGADTKVFGDISMIRRLIVNLTTNAIRATAEGGSVLIQVQPVRGGEAYQWSIVDQGRGISEEELLQISQRQVSMAGGEGLGLSICRQLAGLHLSSLKLESRLGTGTAVSFETIAGGPRSVAEAWSRWRVSQREPLRRPSNREHQSSGTDDSVQPSRQVRFDVPTVMIELGNEGAMPQVDDRITMGTVEVGAATPVEVADSFDELLQAQQRMYDFTYRVEERQWVWVFDANIGDAESRIDMLSDLAKKDTNDIRLSWSEPQAVPLDSRRTAARLTEILVRQSLAATASSIQEMGTSTQSEIFEETETVALRLDQELKRLSARLANQTAVMHAQSQRIRPHF